MPTPGLLKLVRSALESNCWSTFEQPRRDERSRARFAARALTLYHHINPHAEGPGDISDEIVGAIAALREVADSYAICSIDPSVVATTDLPVTRRSTVEWLIRAYGIVDWAKQHGCELQLTGATPLSEPSDAHEVQVTEPELVVTKLLKNFPTILEWYNTARHLRDDLYDTTLPGITGSPTGKDVLQQAELRQQACLNLVVARQITSLAARLVGVEAARLGAVMVCAAEGGFVAAHESRRKGHLYPSVKALHDTLYGDHANSWLEERGGKVPDWLSA
jgi:hypothetical protein